MISTTFDMNFSNATHDYGGGLSLDELVGMPAGSIYSAKLPNGEVFLMVLRASGYMLQAELALYRLVEIWADGHTAWHGDKRDDPVVVTPSGQLIRTRD